MKCSLSHYVRVVGADLASLLIDRPGTGMIPDPSSIAGIEGTEELPVPKGSAACSGAGPGLWWLGGPGTGSSTGPVVNCW